MAQQTKEEVMEQLTGAFDLFGPSLRALGYNLYSIFYIACMPYIVLVCAGVFEYSTIHSSLHRVFIVAAWLTVLGAAWLFMVSVPALLYAQLQSVRHVKAEYSEAMQVGRHYFWRVWGLLLISTVATALGLVLFIVPGLFVLQRIALAPYLLIDKDLGVFEALRESMRLARTYSRAMWGIVGVWVLMYALYLVIPYLGPLIGGGMSIAFYCAAAVRYEEVKELQSGSKRKKSKVASRKKAPSEKELEAAESDATTQPRRTKKKS
jgi:Uncharacterised protein family (UPF0259)